MLEWLEVRLDVGDDKGLVYKCCIETLNSDGDALKQECCLAHIAGSGTQSPTHLSEKLQRTWSYCTQSFKRDWHKKKTLGRNTWPPSVRQQVLRLQQQNDLMHGGKTEQAY